VDEIRISLDASGDPGSVAIVRVDGVVDTFGTAFSARDTLLRARLAGR